MLYFLLVLITYNVAIVDSPTEIIRKLYVEIEIFDFFRDAAEILIVIGVLLVAVRWSIVLLNDVMTKDFNIEIIVKSFIKLVICVIIVQNSINIFFGIKDFTRLLYNEVSTSIDSYASDDVYKTAEVQKLFNDLLNENAALAGQNGGSDNQTYDFDQVLEISKNINITVMDEIKISLIAFFMKFSQNFTKVFILFNGFIRAILLVQMLMLCPIAVSDIYMGGTKSGAGRFARQAIALFLEPIIMLILLSAHSVLVSGLITSWTSGGTAQTIVALFWMFASHIGIILGSRRLSKEIFC